MNTSRRKKPKTTIQELTTKLQKLQKEKSELEQLLSSSENKEIPIQDTTWAIELENLKADLSNTVTRLNPTQQKSLQPLLITYWQNKKEEFSKPTNLSTSEQLELQNIETNITKETSKPASTYAEHINNEFKDHLTIKPKESKILNDAPSHKLRRSAQSGSQSNLGSMGSSSRNLNSGDSLAMLHAPTKALQFHYWKLRPTLLRSKITQYDQNIKNTEASIAKLTKKVNPVTSISNTSLSSERKPAKQSELQQQTRSFKTVESSESSQEQQQPPFTQLSSVDPSAYAQNPHNAGFVQVTTMDNSASLQDKKGDTITNSQATLPFATLQLSPTKFTSEVPCQTSISSRSSSIESTDSTEKLINRPSPPSISALQEQTHKPQLAVRNKSRSRYPNDPLLDADDQINRFINALCANLANMEIEQNEKGHPLKYRQFALARLLGIQACHAKDTNNLINALKGFQEQKNKTVEGLANLIFPYVTKLNQDAEPKEIKGVWNKFFHTLRRLVFGHRRDAYLANVNHFFTDKTNKEINPIKEEVSKELLKKNK